MPGEIWVAVSASVSSVFARSRPRKNVFIASGWPWPLSFPNSKKASNFSGSSLMVPRGNAADKVRRSLRHPAPTLASLLPRGVAAGAAIPFSSKSWSSFSNVAGSRPMKTSAAASRKLRSSRGPVPARICGSLPTPSTNAFARCLYRAISCGDRPLQTGTFGSGDSSNAHTALADAILSKGCRKPFPPLSLSKCRCRGTSETSPYNDGRPLS